MRRRFYPNLRGASLLDEEHVAGDTFAVNTVLAIAACSPRLEVALRFGNAPVGLAALGGPTPRSELIVAAVDLLVRAAGISPAEIEGIATTRGPGSFTGLRVGLATVQGLALANTIPAHAYPSLLIQAFRTQADDVLAVQPARRGAVYAQRHHRDSTSWKTVGKIEVRSIASLVDETLPIAAPSSVELPDGAIRAPIRISAAEALLEIFLTERTPDAGTLTPLYVDPPPAVPPTRTAPPWPPS